jgi:hypothetical protein
MAKYRKRPIVIDAVQWFPGIMIDGVETHHEKTSPIDGYAQYTGKIVGRIETLEGVMDAQPGDWIITGVNGEKYPCKPDIFEKTYELVE